MNSNSNPIAASRQSDPPTEAEEISNETHYPTTTICSTNLDVEISVKVST